VAPGCRDYRYSSFFNPPEPPYSYLPGAELKVFTEEGGGIEDDCSTLLNRTDSVFLLEVQVGSPQPERLNEDVVRIELEVSVGLTESGLVLADTAGLVVDGPGNYDLILPWEISDTLWSGDTLISIIAITRYLSYDGSLVIPMGRTIHDCILKW
jgi:hypothetical protein